MASGGGISSNGVLAVSVLGIFGCRSTGGTFSRISPIIEVAFPYLSSRRRAAITVACIVSLYSEVLKAMVAPTRTCRIRTLEVGVFVIRCNARCRGE